MLTGQTHVLVHIERNNILEGNQTGLVHLNELAISAQRGRTGGQTQNKGALTLVVVDGVGNVLCSPGAHLVIIVFDNQFHIYASIISLERTDVFFDRPIIHLLFLFVNIFLYPNSVTSWADTAYR